MKHRICLIFAEFVSEPRTFFFREMTMDYGSQSRADIKMPSPRISSNSDITNLAKLEFSGVTKTAKRAFDVAFLMLPDEKMKNKCEKQPRLNADAVVTYPSQLISVKSDEILRQNHQQQRYFDHSGHKMDAASNSELEMINRGVELINNNNNNDSIRTSRYSICPQSSRLCRIYDDPTICLNDVNSARTTTAKPHYNGDSEMPKSAFTKVPHHNRPLPESPIPSSSPDQMSCPSSSPPISTSPPRHVIYQNFRPEYRLVNAGQFHTISQLQAAQNQKFKQQFMYRPIMAGADLSGPAATNVYMPTANFPFGNAGGGGGGNGHHFVPVQPDLSGIVRHPAAAAALLTSLIPPTIATSFTLTAQNVCAKCNISFRMTSDLVYHMRSHHKSEFTGDTNRRKREEKLKCPVCNESFRERHHLTRHMTAHQDKASDEAETIQLHRRHK